MKKFSIRLFLIAVAFMAALLTSCSSDSDSEDETYYTVNFYGNYEGSGNVGYRSASDGESITLYGTYEVTRKGYHLKGWSEDKDATEATYTPGQSVKVEKDMNLYAVWEKIESCTITYDAAFIAAEASESEKKTQTVTVKNTDEKVALEANTFTREGYVFTGWATSASSTTATYTDEAETDLWDDTTLYAVWLERSSVIQVTLNKNDGSSESEEKIIYVKKNTSFTLPSAPFTREGYTFSGWAKNPSSKTKSYANEAYVYSSDAGSDITLYALWHDDSHYVITFYPNYTGSSDSYVEQAVEKNENGTIATLDENTFTRDGYVFYGWYTSSTLSTSGSTSNFYLDEDSVTLTGDKDLYACWLSEDSASSVKIIFNKNDGSSEPEEKSQYLKYGSKPSSSYSYSYYSSTPTNYNRLAKNTFTRENYTFAGWAKSASGTKSYSDGEELYVTSGMTLYALWTYTGSVTVTFNGNGGQNAAGKTETSQNLTGNVSAGLSVNSFTKEGYHFIGWAKEADATSKEYSDGATVTFTEPTVTLYAVWEANPKVTFDGNGGSDSSGNTTLTQILPYGTSTALNANTFKKANSTFIGWGTSPTATYATYKDGSSAYLTSDLTLYALWKDDLPLTFHANGGSGSDFTQTVAYNLSLGAYKLTFPENSFTNSGYTFAGWGTSSSSKSATAAAGEEKSLSESTTDYYAIWASSSVTVNFDPNSTYGGSGNSFTQNLVFDSSILKYTGTLPENSFTSEKGNFVGLYVSKKSSSSNLIMEAGKNIEITLSELSSYTDDDGTITLYAIWNPKSYTVTYNTLGNGENILDVLTNTAEYGEAMSYTVRTQAAESAYDYYTFQGWGQYSTSTSYIDGSTISLSGDKTIYAVWKLGTIGESSGTEIKSGNYIAIPFTLVKDERISVAVSSNDTDNDLQMWLVDSENYALFAAGNTFSYKTTVSSDSGTYSLSASATYPSGSYYYIIKNKALLEKHTVTYTIKAAE